MTIRNVYRACGRGLPLAIAGSLMGLSAGPGCQAPAEPDGDISARGQTVTARTGETATLARNTTPIAPGGKLANPGSGGDQAGGGFNPGAVFGVQDHTPICHYLERGIDDLVDGQRNVYVVSPDGIATMADIDHLTLGLDKPYTKCTANPRSIPCTDKDVTTDWCIEKLELFVGNKKLYEKSDPGGCAMHVGGGKGGMRTITGSQLRAHALWGWTIDELKTFINMVQPGGDGGFDLAPPAVVFGADYLALTLEGVVGDFLARSNKGCANSMYCDQRRGWFGQDGDGPLAFFSRSDKVNCDHGGCPAKADRRSSPWVEIRGIGGTRVGVDLDLELANSTYDPDDCQYDHEKGDWDCGNDYAYLARGSVEFQLDFPCTDTARVNVSGKGTRTMPYCAGATPASPCFKPSALPQQSGKVKCDEGDDSDLCDRNATLIKSVFKQSVGLAGTPTFDAEGGFLPGLIDALCPIFLGPTASIAGCSADAIGTKAINESLDATLFDQTLFGNLDGCPKLQVKPDGRVSFDFRELDACPEGAHNPACGPGTSLGGLGGGQGGQGGNGGGGGGLSPGGFQVAVQPPVAPPMVTNVVASLPAPQTPFVPAFVAVSALPIAPGLVIESEAEAQGPAAGKNILVAGGVAAGPAPVRLKPYEVNGMLVNLCAVQRHCADGFDLRPVLNKLNDAQLTALATGGLGDLDPATAQILMNDAPFMSQCVAVSHPHDAGNLGAKAAALTAWAADVEAEAARTDGNSCKKKTPGIEAMMPVPGVYLAITTADHSVSDQFAFMNMRKDTHPSDIPQGTRERLACAHIKDSYLPPAQPPTCVDGKDEDGNDCGTQANGPCVDIRETPGQLPDLLDPEAHPNGDYSPFHRCGWNDATNRPMTCVRKQFNGAGGGVFGVCKICGVPGGESPGDYTMQGCEVQWGGNTHECPQDYALGADGRCWRVHEPRPEWECEADCQGVYGSYGYCFHSGAWRTWWEDHDPIVEQAIAQAQQAGGVHAPAICAEYVSCALDGLSCAARGLACSNDQCVTECTSDAHCDPYNGYPLKYPEGFVCSAQNTCRL